MRAQTVTHDCPAKGCGMIFDVPVDLDDKWRKSGESFYCPAGHSMSYNGGLSKREKEEKQRREKAEREAEAAAARERQLRSRLEEAAERTERHREQLRGLARTCPLCDFKTRRTNPDRVRAAIGAHLMEGHNATRKPIALLPPGEAAA